MSLLIMGVIEKPTDIALLLISIEFSQYWEGQQY